MNRMLCLIGGTATLSLAFAAITAPLLQGDGMSIALLSVFVAALVSSIAGFAFSPLCAVLLLPFSADPLRLVATLLLASLTIQATCLWQIRRTIAWTECQRFVLGGLLTLPVGLALLMALPMRSYQLVLGFLLVGYASWMILRREVDLPLGSRPIYEWLAGAAGGLTGGLAAFPGGPVVAWLGWRGAPKTQARGIVQPYIFLMQLATLALLATLAPGRGAGTAVDPALLLVMPPAVFGTLAGMQVYRQLTNQQYGRVVNVLLLTSGLAMLLLGR